MVQKWEYWSGLMHARIMRKTKDMQDEALPRYSPEHLIPQLNAMGEEGWELIHMEPVLAGNNEDVLMHDTTRNWTNDYFCVFKRPRTF